MSAPILLQLEHATFRAPDGSRLFAGDLVICAGERWAIVGQAGSGKGLLLEGLLGRLPLDSGRLRHPLWESDPRFPDTTFGVLPPGTMALASMVQHSRLLQDRDFHQLRWHASLSADRLTVDDFLSRNLVEGRHPAAVLDEAGAAPFAAARAREIARFGLAPLLHRPLPALSNGELHRLLLARALMRDPRILLLDEPFAGLDAGHRAALCAALDALPNEGRDAVLATSREEDLPDGVTHVVRLEHRRVVGTGPRMAARPRASRQRPSFAIPPLPTRPLPAGEPLVDLRDVTVKTGATTILDHVDFRMGEGERWVLHGENGSGKSTLLSLILADHPQAHANHVAVAGRQLGPGYGIWDRKALLGWVSPELDAHYPGYATLLDVVVSGFAASLGMHREAAPDERAQARQWLMHLGLSPSQDQRLGDATTLDRRLALLARAAVHRPALLLFDEPCQGLDADGRAHFLAAADAVVTALKAGLLLVTHDPSEIPAYVHRVIALQRGHVRYQGPRAGLPDLAGPTSQAP